MRGTLVFAGSSHPRLVDEICHRLGLAPAKVQLRKFSNGETSVEIKSSVRDQDVFIVQSGSAEINDCVMEMLIMINACKGGSAKSITAVMPYFPYSRQSKRKTHRGSIAARMLANLMKVAGVDHVITIDLHASQMQGFFRCPVDNLIAQPILAKWIKTRIPDWERVVVVSKNPGGTKRATSLADLLKLSFGIVTTERRRAQPSTGTGYGTPINGSLLLQRPNTLLDGVDTPQSTVDHGDARGPRLPPNSIPREQDFARANSPVTPRSTGYTHHGPYTTPLASIDTPSSRLTNGQASPTPPSSYAPSGDTDTRDLRRIQSVPGITQSGGQQDTDGYEEAEGSDTDDHARDVITGRLISGHIVDDDVPSPSASVSSGLGGLEVAGRHQYKEDDGPDPMMMSFISTASSRLPGHGLGGTGDATASDEEEEQALQDPKIESTVTLVGNVRGRPVVIVDDMIDKAGSWIAAAETVTKRGGATKVYCMATHGIFGGNSLHELQNCEQIDAIVVTSSFPVSDEKRLGVTKLEMLDVAGLLAEAIRRNHHGESISQLYYHLYE